MELIIPDILAEARHLSLLLLLSGLVLGLVLWLAGWWTYRFWVAMLTTVAAGVLGLYEASTFHMQPLLAALLLAIAAGLLALSLMRLFAFVAAGVLVMALARVVAPSVDAPWVCFLAGGIVAILLFRPWVMALTSFGGSLLLWHVSLCLAEPCLSGDCVPWGRTHWIMLNWFCLFTTAVGVLLQLVIHRRANKLAKSSGTGKSGSSGLMARMRARVPFRKAA